MSKQVSTRDAFLAIVVVLAAVTLPELVRASDLGADAVLGDATAQCRVTNPAANVDGDRLTGIGPFEAHWRDIPADTYAPLTGHTLVGPYRLVPQLRGHEDPQVVAYVAYNTRTGRSEYVVGPDQLSCFSEAWQQLATLAQ
jgi:hypothetical protein